MTVNTTDYDEGPNAETIYSLTPTDIFNVDEISGLISLNSLTALNREENDTYYVVVQATNVNDNSRSSKWWNFYLTALFIK